MLLSCIRSVLTREFNNYFFSHDSYATLRNASKSALSEQDIERSMDGNLCRCTGYRPILDALKTFAKPTEPDSGEVDYKEKAKDADPCERFSDQQEATNGLNARDFYPLAPQMRLCPKGEKCCRLAKESDRCDARESAVPSRRSSPSSDRNGVSSGNDATFASSKEPLPISSVELARSRIASGERDALLEYDDSSEPIFPPWLLRTQKGEEGKDDRRSIWDKQDLAFVDVSCFPLSDSERSRDGTRMEPLENERGEDGEEETGEEDGNERRLNGNVPQQIRKRGTIWLRPSTLSSLIAMLRFYDARATAVKLRSGDSECRIEVKFGHREYNVNTYTGMISSLTQLEATNGQLSIGSLLPLSDVVAVLKKKTNEALRECSRQPAKYSFCQQVFRAVLSNAAHFASTQVRNVACIGGNIATASPISDLNPIWLALNAEVHYIDALANNDYDARAADDAILQNYEKKISMAKFFKGYRKTALPAGAVITRVTVPLLPPAKDHEVSEVVCFTRAYKQAKRVDDDIATVTCCLYLEVDATEGPGIIKEARFAFGGMGPTTALATETAKEVCGAKVDDCTVLDRALDRLSSNDFDLRYDVPGGMASFRKSLALSFLAKFWSEITEELQRQQGLKVALPDIFKGLSRSSLVRPVTQGSQDVESLEVTVKGGSGEPMPHLNALKQCAGTADYVDDIAIQSGELIGALVLTTMANARIIKVDGTPAVEPRGPALHFVDANDLTKLGGRNSFLFDDRFFAGNESEAVGMVIGIVLAKTKRLAQAAARLVEVEYESLGPPILDIDSAIRTGSFLAPRPKIQTASDEVFDDWSDCDHVLDGTTRLGGQSHFYLETNACLVVPSKEDDEMDIWSSTQNPSETQAYVAEALRVPMNRINVRVKRIGGGFGGKESRSIILAAVLAVASKISGRPVRCQLDRDEDMLFNGQRHPFKGEWKIGLTRLGLVKKLDVKVYNNAGHSQDLSRAVLERAMLHIDGCYRWAALRVRGWMCRTHTVSNTAFRGFGGPQGIFIIEDALTKAAHSLGMNPEEVRHLNLNVEGDLTHYKQPLVDWNVPTMWQALKCSSDFDRRRLAVDKFNTLNRWKKRGITLQATRFGLSYTFLTLNQARCLVHIYAHDGSVMISHAGVEMGQGLHSKVSQVAASELGVDVGTIHISGTSTRETANTSATAASVGSDLNGAAVKDGESCGSVVPTSR